MYLLYSTTYNNYNTFHQVVQHYIIPYTSFSLIFIDGVCKANIKPDIKLNIDMPNIDNINVPTVTNCLWYS